MSAAELKSISLIVTVLNERDSIQRWMTAIERQSLLPDELVIVDGGSTDGTFELLCEWNPPYSLTLVQAPGSSIAQGRNCALEIACGDLIAVTDAGTIANPDWLYGLSDTFLDHNIDVAAGFFAPRVRSVWDASIAATTLPDAVEIDTQLFLPSSRSLALRRSWIDIGMRYPEWLDYCEDVVFDLSLKRAGAKFQFVPEAIVDFEPRQTILDFWEQYFRYARGDGKAGLFLLRHLLRYATYTLATGILLRKRPVELALATLLGFCYLRVPWIRLWRRSKDDSLTDRERLTAAMMVPLLRLWGDFAKMAGYPVGLAWRIQHFGLSLPCASWRTIPPSFRLQPHESHSRRNRRTRALRDV